MSKFLAPIHFRQYDKVKNQNMMVEEILKLNEEIGWDPDLRTEVEAEFESLSDRPLDEIIDQKDIHGWISGKIDLVESKLAFVVSRILRENETREGMILDRIKTLGLELEVKENLGLMEAFQVINQMFLEGMPCDRINEILENHEGKLVWERKTDIHSRYWNYGYGPGVYYRIKDSFIDGLVEQEDIVYENIGGSIYSLEFR